MASCHNLEKSTSVLRDRVDSLLQTQRTLNAKGRVLVSLAGVPGSGKSTISDALLRELAFHGIDQIAILPMVSDHVRQENAGVVLHAESNFPIRMAFTTRKQPSPHSRTQT